MRDIQLFSNKMLKHIQNMLSDSKESKYNLSYPLLAAVTDREASVIHTNTTGRSVCVHSAACTLSPLTNEPCFRSKL